MARISLGGGGEYVRSGSWAQVQRSNDKRIIAADMDREFNDVVAALTAINKKAAPTPGRGTQALPSYTFGGDTDTGMYSPGANTVALSTGNTEALKVSWDGTDGTLTLFGDTTDEFLGLDTIKTNVATAKSAADAAKSAADAADTKAAAADTKAAAARTTANSANTKAAAAKTTADAAQTTANSANTKISAVEAVIDGITDVVFTTQTSFDGITPTSTIMYFIEEE